MGTAQKKAGPGCVELFNYPATSQTPATPDWQGWGGPSEPDEPEIQNQEQARSSGEIAAAAEFEKRLAEETRRSFDAGRERGRQEGILTERETHSAAQKAAEDRNLREHAALVANFAQERERYLSAAEQEVVKLALAVAARILRREAQMDPLLLTGAVRVALGQLSGSTEVRLSVPAKDLNLWTEAISLIPNLAVKPTIFPDEKMRLGDCIVETSMGSVDLGVRSQLGEIERGFFDRAGSPAVPATLRNSPPQPPAVPSEANQ